ncbi:MAG: corrinoid activation/regeneration protein AcsV [bacterium]
MEKCRVVFQPMNKDIEVNKGENLLNAARKAGVNIDSPCGGKGSCGKCRVILEKGELKTENTSELTPEEKAKGYYLACISTVETDVVIKVPLESLVETLKINDDKNMKQDRHSRLLNTLEERKKDGLTISPNVKKIYLQLDEPTLDDNISDLERVKRSLRAEGLDEVTFTLKAIRELANALRKGNWQVTLTLTNASKNWEVIQVSAGDTTSTLLGLAIDIGTTGIATCLVNLIDGSVLESGTAYNAQVSCGADIISRIIYATKNDGKNLKELRRLVVKTINELIEDMLSRLDGVNYEDIISIVASGNTTMTHLFLETDPQYIRVEPYIPTVDKFPELKASNFFLKVNPEAYVYCSPNVASYVGGDITAGILASGITNSETLTLFTDLGTNGELVFGNQDWLMTCACSAGPAFEGGEITYGMRAAPGAIEKIKIDKDTHEVSYVTIGDAKPKGICGSGLVDALAQLMLSGIMDRRGKLSRELKDPRIIIDQENDLAEYVIAWENETQINRYISISEVDIDNFIRAKGAVYSGCATLVNSMGMDFTMVEKVLIAGGIGNHLGLEPSIAIGLFPDIENEKFELIGNSSLTGSYLILLSGEMKQKVEEIADQMTYVELSVYPGYMDEFMSTLFLPHTNLDAFPRVKALLGE